MFYLINKHTGVVIKESESKSSLRRQQRKAENKAELKVSKFSGSFDKAAPFIRPTLKKLHQNRLKYRVDQNGKKVKVMSLRKALRKGYHIHETCPTKLYAR